MALVTLLSHHAVTESSFVGKASSLIRVGVLGEIAYVLFHFRKRQSYKMSRLSCRKEAGELRAGGYRRAEPGQLSMDKTQRSSPPQPPRRSTLTSMVRGRDSGWPSGRGECSHSVVPDTSVKDSHGKPSPAGGCAGPQIWSCPWPSDGPGNARPRMQLERYNDYLKYIQQSIPAPTRMPGTGYGHAVSVLSASSTSPIAGHGWPLITRHGSRHA